MYAKHKEIPPIYKKVILDQTSEFKIKDVPLDVCNEIIREHLEFDSNLFEEFTQFTIEAIKDGNRIEMFASSVDEADDLMDEIIEHGDRPDVTMVLRQNDRLVRGYIKGRVIYPSSYKGREDVTPRKDL